MDCDHPDSAVEVTDPYSDEAVCTACGVAVQCDGPWDDDGNLGWVAV